MVSWVTVLVLSWSLSFNGMTWTCLFALVLAAGMSIVGEHLTINQSNSSLMRTLVCLFVFYEGCTFVCLAAQLACVSVFFAASLYYLSCVTWVNTSARFSNWLSVVSSFWMGIFLAISFLRSWAAWITWSSDVTVGFVGYLCLKNIVSDMVSALVSF